MGPANNVKPAETEASILKNALDVFSHKGYEDATISAIAKQTGVNNLTVFRHFKDKKTLFLSVVDFYAACRADTEALDELVSYEDIGRDLSALAHAYFEIVFSNIHILRIFIEESVYFDEIKKQAWFIPTALKEHFANYLNQLKHRPPFLDQTDLAAEMFVAHIVRRVLEYNKHSSHWIITEEMLRDFDKNMQPQIKLMVSIF
jgi:AcrR family transcriptional regulator